jgi:hypothetical protein
MKGCNTAAECWSGPDPAPATATDRRRRHRPPGAIRAGFRCTARCTLIAQTTSGYGLNVGSLRCRNLSGLGGRPDSVADLAKTAIMTQGERFLPDAECVRLLGWCSRPFQPRRAFQRGAGDDTNNRCWIGSTA